MAPAFEGGEDAYITAVVRTLISCPLLEPGYILRVARTIRYNRKLTMEEGEAASGQLRQMAFEDQPLTPPNEPMIMGFSTSDCARRKTSGRGYEA